MKINYIWFTIIILLLGYVAFLRMCQKPINNEADVFSTNVIQMTNVISVKPKPVYVEITNTTYIIATNISGLVDTNVNILLTIDEYSNLQIIITRESNYVNSDIQGTYSNGYIIVSHYETTNVFKLPESIVNKVYKDNQITLGYTINGKVLGNYQRRLGDIEFLKTEYGLGIATIFEKRKDNPEKIDVDAGGLIYFKW